MGYKNVLNVGGIPEMIQEDLNGLIFKSNDPMSCYEKILQFIFDNEGK